jgi:hypothetical protein
MRRSGEERGRRRGRVARFCDRARSRPWAVLVIANVLPICASAYILYGYRTGKIAFVPGSEAVVPSLVFLVALIAAMFILSWVAAPLLREAVKAVHGFVQAQTTAIARGGMLAFFFRFPALVGAMVAYAVLFVNVVLLALLLAGGSVLLIVSLGVFAVEVMKVRG